MRAMSNKLPRVIDPVYCAQHEKEYVVSVSQGQFLRLVERVNSAENDVLVEVKFFRHKQLRLPALNLKLKTKLSLNCQRSLDTFEYEVEVELTGVFVDSISSANEIPDSIEMYEVVDDEVLLLDLIEDELLLDIPLSPVSDSAVMAYENKEPEFEEKSSEENLTKKENPFAALRALQKGD